LKHSDHITARVQLIIKFVQRALLLAFICSHLLVVGRRSASGVERRGISKILDLCHPHPQNFTIGDRALGIRKLNAILMCMYRSPAQVLARKFDANFIEPYPSARHKFCAELIDVSIKAPVCANSV
jgi:hypothetical protein